MVVTLRPWTPADLEAWRALVELPPIARQFSGFLAEGGVEGELADPHMDRGALRMAFDGDVPVGITYAFLLTTGASGWAMIRVAVHPEHQGRGIGRRLLEATIAHLEANRSIRELAVGAWLPEPAIEALVAKLGFTHDRSFWRMTRERGAASPVPEWPAGIVVRPFDRSERDVVGYMDAYNDSFAEHYRYVPTTLAEMRSYVAKKGFRPDGTLLAWRGDECVGFSHNVLGADRAEVATLGTAKSARGIGLGRALLRAGVAWIEANSTLPVTLLVDGKNENALELYRQEGFEVRDTRVVWIRPVARA